MTGTTYGAGGQLLGFTTIGGETETRVYNVLGQLTKIKREQDPSTVVDLQYNYSGTQNNGRILSMTDAVSGET